MVDDRGDFVRRMLSASEQESTKDDEKMLLHKLEVLGAKAGETVVEAFNELAQESKKNPKSIGVYAAQAILKILSLTALQLEKTIGEHAANSWTKMMVGQRYKPTTEKPPTGVDFNDHAASDAEVTAAATYGFMAGAEYIAMAQPFLETRYPSGIATPDLLSIATGATQQIMKAAYMSLCDDEGAQKADEWLLAVVGPEILGFIKHACQLSKKSEEKGSGHESGQPHDVPDQGP